MTGNGGEWGGWYPCVVCVCYEANLSLCMSEWVRKRERGREGEKGREEGRERKGGREKGRERKGGREREREGEEGREREREGACTSSYTHISQAVSRSGTKQKISSKSVTGAVIFLCTNSNSSRPERGKEEEEVGKEDEEEEKEGRRRRRRRERRERRKERKQSNGI